ncbi:MAG: glycosyltransferase family 2 protein [Candidatus Elarobacter sp.]
MNAPLVSVGLPVRNGERFLAQAIDSILAQTFEDFELIISDNASTDATPAIAATYAERDTRVRFLRNASDRGAAYNYNRVTALARGRYIRHAAHDDVLAPTNLERCVALLEADASIVLAYPQMSRIDESGTVMDTFRGSLDLDEGDPVARWRRFVRLIHQGSMCDPVFGVFRADALRDTPVLRSIIGADMLLLGDIVLRGRVVEVPEVLFFERWFAGTSVNANPTPNERAAWFDPAAKNDLLNAVPQWRWLDGYLRSIAVAPLSASQRAACAVALAPWLWEHKRGLALGPLGLAARIARIRPLALWVDRAVLGLP